MEMGTKFNSGLVVTNLIGVTWNRNYFETSEILFTWWLLWL